MQADAWSDAELNTDAWYESAPSVTISHPGGQPYTGTESEPECKCAACLSWTVALSKPEPR